MSFVNLSELFSYLQNGDDSAKSVCFTGSLGNRGGKQPLFIKEKERNWCFHSTCHVPDTVWFSQQPSEVPLLSHFVGIERAAQRGYLSFVSPQSWKKKELGFGPRLD